MTQQNGHGRAFTIPSRKYEGRDERTRRELFAKDREIRKLTGQLASARSALTFIAAVADGAIGGHDPAWQVAAIQEALTSYTALLSGSSRTSRGSGPSQ